MKAERQASSSLVQTVDGKESKPGRRSSVCTGQETKEHTGCQETKEHTGWQDHCRRGGDERSSQGPQWLTDWFLCVVMYMRKWACVYYPDICVEVRTTCGNWFYSSIMRVLEITLRCLVLMARPLPAQLPHSSTARFYARKLHKNKKPAFISLWLLCVAWPNHFWTS